MAIADEILLVCDETMLAGTALVYDPALLPAPGSAVVIAVLAKPQGVEGVDYYRIGRNRFPVPQVRVTPQHVLDTLATVPPCRSCGGVWFYDDSGRLQEEHRWDCAIMGHPRHRPRRVPPPKPSREHTEDARYGS